MKANWRKLSERSVFKNGIVHIVEKDLYSGSVGDSTPFTIVEMNNWVTIVPLTANNELLIVRQFRAGPEDDTLEFPGGGINKGEAPLQAAIRELREETGATASDFILLSAMDPNPAFMDNKCHVFLAKNADITDKQHLDRFEDNEVISVPFQGIISMVKRGEFRQSISLAALGLFLASGIGCIK